MGAERPEREKGTVSGGGGGGGAIRKERGVRDKE